MYNRKVQYFQSQIFLFRTKLLVLHILPIANKLKKYHKSKKKKIDIVNFFIRFPLQNKKN